MSNHLFTYLLRLADDRLVLGHRLSEWCGHGPILEEDIALSNVSLDLIGQATLLLRYAAEVEGQGRNEDALAYWRGETEFRNALLVELPKGDYAFTITRQFLFDVFNVVLTAQLQGSRDEVLAGIAAKAHKEARYHVRHSGEWLIRFGDGTDESRRRAQAALDELWAYHRELFVPDEVDAAMHAAGIGPDLAALEPAWREVVDGVLGRATLAAPSDPWVPSGGRRGRHTEHLGHMLAEMQSVARSHPGAGW